MQRGISGNDQHPTDWERQRERLSAYLDGELEPIEHAELERHLVACPACQDELQDLRALRSMLQALPAPALPRSFLIPEDGAVPVPIARRRAVAPPISSATRRGPRIAEWVGALVASLGLALLLGSALAGHGATSYSAAPALQSTSGAAQTTSGGPNSTTPTFDQSHTPAAQTGDPTDTAIPTKDSTPTPLSTTNSGGDRGGAEPATVEAVPAALPIGGAGLLVGGAVVFVVGRASAKRRIAA